MFLGHFAVGLAARRLAPRLSLAGLFVAAQLADLLWPVFVALGLETVRIRRGDTAFTPLEFVSYPWSHSLLLLVVWGLVLGALLMWRTHRARTLGVITVLVVSHWVLDAISHRPDMPLYPGGRKVGLGLWNSVPATIAVELAMFFAGVWIYQRVTRPRDARGRWGFTAFVVALLLIYVANIVNGPPPSVAAVWIAGLIGGAVIVVWSAWFDRHRTVMLAAALVVIASMAPIAQTIDPDLAGVAGRDRARMMAQVGAHLPQHLPPLADDPHRPPGLMPKPDAPDAWIDDAGNTYVRSEWGTWSNYDESKAGGYRLPDPLKLDNGTRVTSAAMWRTRRRPEILRHFEEEIYGRIPASTPAVAFRVISIDRARYAGRAVVKRVVGRIDNSRFRAAEPIVDITMYLPPAAPPGIPIVVMAGTFRQRLAPTELPQSVLEVLAQGWAFATVNTGELQADSGVGLRGGIIGVVNEGRPRAPDDWGVLAAWSWGLSRALDYFATDPAVDATHAAVQGHSRWGKTALLAGALDERWAAVWASCSGAMGASLETRNWGETIDNVAAVDEYHWMAGNFLKYAGHWRDMPVDAHELIALVAPRPVFVTGGTRDQWSDPHGEFQAALGAEPVYRLLGKRGLITRGLMMRDMPPPDLPLTGAELAYLEHDGGHTDAPDWPVFIDWAGRYLAPARRH